MEKKILRHVEWVEFSKQMARELAVKAVEQLNLAEVLSDDIGRVVDVLLAADLVLLQPHIERITAEAAIYGGDLGLPVPSPALIEEVIAQRRREFIDGARPALMHAVGTSVLRIHDAMRLGIHEETIQNAINSDETSGALMAPVASALKRYSAGFIQGLERGVNDAALRSLQPTTTGPSPQLVWIAIGNTCKGDGVHSCESRHGTVMSIEDWPKQGTPGSPLLHCSMWSARGSSPCKCVLASPDLLQHVPHPVKAAEAVRRGKERAKANRA